MRWLPGSRRHAGPTNLCPGFHRQLRDLDGGRVDDGHLSTVLVLVGHHLVDGTTETFVVGKLPWAKQWLWFISDISKHQPKPPHPPPPLV